MDLNILKCPACGGHDRFTKVTEIGGGLWHCEYCNNSFTESTLEREYEKLEATVKMGLGSVIDDALVRDRSEKYYNLRSMLWSKATAKYIDSRALVDISRDILSIAPHDFLAEFFEVVNSGNDDDAVDYIRNIDVEENALFIDMVLDFLIRSLNEKFITPTAMLLERCGSIFSPEKRQEYLTRFEAEAKLLESGIYEVGLQRDVFLAYSSKDMAEVVKLLGVIESSGLTCFAAFRNLKHGKDAVANYEKALHEAIDNCSVFVFVSSVNSRSFGCDAFKKELFYIKNQEMQKFPTFRSYEQIPAKNKKLRIEYRLDNTPNLAIDKTVKEFFSGLTYAETHEQLLTRLGEYMELLNSPFIDDEAKIREVEAEAQRKIDNEKRRADALEEELSALKKQQTESAAKHEADIASGENKEEHHDSEDIGKASNFSDSDNKNDFSFGSLEISDKNKAWLMFFACLFLGHFGVHRFIEKDNKMGIIYLFTMGLFHIGWLIDSYKYLKKALKAN